MRRKINLKYNLEWTPDTRYTVGTTRSKPEGGSNEVRTRGPGCRKIYVKKQFFKYHSYTQTCTLPSKMFLMKMNKLNQ